MLHIAQPVDQLLHHLNVAISNGVIREREHVLEGDPLNFRVTQLEPHPLTRNVDRLQRLRRLGAPKPRR